MLFRVYFLSQSKTDSGLPAGIGSISSPTKRAWTLGFPFDCIVIEGNGSGEESDLLFIGDWLKKNGYGYSIGETSRSIRLDKEKGNSRQKEAVSLYVARAALIAFFESAGSFLEQSKEWVVRSYSKYSKVTTLQLLTADEVREKHDRSLMLRVRLESTCSLLADPFNTNWKELREFGAGKQGPTLEQLESLMSSWESIQEALELLMDRVSEKKFLFWEMLAEYMIVVLILLELVIGIMDYIHT